MYMGDERHTVADAPGCHFPPENTLDAEWTTARKFGATIEALLSGWIRSSLDGYFPAGRMKLEGQMSCKTGNGIITLYHQRTGAP